MLPKPEKVDFGKDLIVPEYKMTRVDPDDVVCLLFVVEKDDGQFSSSYNLRGRGSSEPDTVIEH